MIPGRPSKGVDVEVSDSAEFGGEVSESDIVLKCEWLWKDILSGRYT